LLHSLHDQRYLAARAAQLDGETVVGLRWLRHQHAHRIVVTGRGGAKRNFFGPSGFGPPFYISPSNRWMQRSDIPTDGRKPDRVAEGSYDARVAGYPLDDPITEALKWFDTILTAGGIDPLQDIDEEDPTVL